MDIEWNQLKLGEFSSDSSVADLHRMWAHVFAPGGGSENLWNYAKHTALFIELRCALWTEELSFSGDTPFVKCTNRNFEPCLQIPPRLQWNDASLFL